MGVSYDGVLLHEATVLPVWMVMAGGMHSLAVQTFEASEGEFLLLDGVGLFGRAQVMVLGPFSIGV